MEENRMKYTFEALLKHPESTLPIPSGASDEDLKMGVYGTFGECINSAINRGAILVNKSFNSIDDTPETIVVEFHDEWQWILCVVIFILSESSYSHELSDDKFYTSPLQGFYEKSDEEFDLSKLLERAVFGISFDTLEDALNHICPNDKFLEGLVNTDGLYFTIKHCGRIYLYTIEAL